MKLKRCSGRIGNHHWWSLDFVHGTYLRALITVWTAPDGSYTWRWFQRSFRLPD